MESQLGFEGAGRNETDEVGGCEIEKLTAKIK